MQLTFAWPLARAPPVNARSAQSRHASKLSGGRRTSVCFWISSIYWATCFLRDQGLSVDSQLWNLVELACRDPEAEDDG